MLREPVRVLALAAGVALLVALPFAVRAQEVVSGPYLTVQTGVVLEPRTDLTGSGIKAQVGYDPGFLVDGGLGYRFENGIRLETELGYRRNMVSNVSGKPASGVGSALGAMSDLLYDIPLDSPVIPYVGVGIGGARVSFNAHGAGTGPSIGKASINDNDLDFAYQGIVGASYPLTERLQLITDYRYFATVPGTFRTTSGSQVKANYASHTVTVGFRWNFGVARAQAAAAAPVATPAFEAPAAAPAPAAAAAARSFVVFFDFDKADLSASSRKVVEQAALAIKGAQIARIQVTGHADRAGPEKYNFRLSLRRANAVKSELIHLGVAADQVEVLGKGMTEPAVPTPIGVREPRNRRAEIVF